ncbi:hypothetical protein Tco_0509981, partial [Tanacetum coccineum]
MPSRRSSPTVRAAATTAARVAVATAAAATPMTDVAEATILTLELEELYALP